MKTETSPPSASAATGLDVLVVEDELRIRHVLTKALAEMGFHSTTAPSAEAAQRIMKETRFDILILDLNLPGMNGLEFLQIVRRHHPDTQVIILTGFGDLEAAKLAIHLDVVDFLTKPCALGSLEVALDRARKRRKQQLIESAPESSTRALHFAIREEKPQTEPRRVPESTGAPGAALDEMEREAILRTLEKNKGNRAATAEELGISLRKLYYRLSEYQRRAFTLVELLVVIGIISVLIAILLPTLSKAREQANRVRCAENVRQIVMSMLIYAHNDHNQSFPRVIFNSANPKLLLDSTGYRTVDTFGKTTYVGENNVPASLFLLMRSLKLSPRLFVCPATGAAAGFANSAQIEQASNWEKIPDNLSYSMATPYPSSAAVEARFAWRNTMRSDFALIGDMNPGTRGGALPPNNVSAPTHTSPDSELAFGNSNNHRNRGQNVGYSDGHVQFATTCYCGAVHRSTGLRDNIYTNGAGDGGSCDDRALPVDAQDSVLFPTDDFGGK